MPPIITFYSDSTSNFPVAYEFINYNKNLLAKNNIYVPTISSQPFYKIKSHRVVSYNLFTLFNNKKAINNIWSNWYDELRGAVRENKNILLFGYIHSRDLPIFSFLREQKDFSNCIFRIILVQGRLACEMEQYAYQYSCFYNMNWDVVINYIINKTRNIFFLKNNNLGVDDIKIFLDDNEGWIAKELSEAQKMALSYAGLPVADSLFYLPPHALCLKSLAARALLDASSVGDNSWPPLNNLQFMNFLVSLEEEGGFDASPFSNPISRKLLCEREAALFEELEKTNSDDITKLCCPKNLFPDNPWNPFIEVADEQLEGFARKLPSSLAYVIKRRYATDSELLTKTQHKLKILLDTFKPQNKRTVNRIEPLLSVLTMTYNHEKYIEKCIESVQKQRTKFPVQHIIIDDCSTDETPEIIKRCSTKYTNIRPILLNNKSIKGTVAGLLGRCRTEFAALCDGDDYFTHADKLQKQVDFLNTYNECSLCFHPVDVVYEDGSPTKTYPSPYELPGGERMFYPLTALLYRNCIQTNSVVYRWRFRDGLPSWFVPDLCPGDWYWHLLHAEKGLIGFLPEHMSVYRRHKRAIYIETEKGNFTYHRSRFGMAELRLYYVLDKHFKGKYTSFFCRLANGVFYNFIQIYLNSGDATLLKRSIKLYSFFAYNFYDMLISNSIKVDEEIKKMFACVKM